MNNSYNAVTNKKSYNYTLIDMRSSTDDGCLHRLRSRDVRVSPNQFNLSRSDSDKPRTGNSKRSPKKPALNLSTDDVTGYVSEDDEAISRFDRFATDKSKEQSEAESKYLTRKFARLATRYFNDHRNEEFIPEYELIKPLAHEAALSPTLGIEYHTNFVARPKGKHEGKSTVLDVMLFAAVKGTRCDFFEVQSCYILGPVKSPTGAPGVDVCTFCDDIIHPKGWGTTCC